MHRASIETDVCTTYIYNFVIYNATLIDDTYNSESTQLLTLLKVNDERVAIKLDNWKFLKA